MATLSSEDAANIVYQGNMQAIGALSPIIEYSRYKDYKDWAERTYQRQLDETYKYDQMVYDRALKARYEDRFWALEDYNRQRKDYLSDLVDERAYNSPAAQMERMLAAGLNPALYYGNGSVVNTSSGTQVMPQVSRSAPNVPQASLPSAPSWNPSSISGLMSGLVNASMTDIRRDEMRAEIDLKRAEVIKTLRSADLDFSRKENQDIANRYADAMFQTDLQEKAARTNEILDSMQTSFVNRVVSTYGMKLTEAQINNLNASTSKMFGELKSLVQQMEFFSEVRPYRVSSEREYASASVLENNIRRFEHRWNQTLREFEENELRFDKIGPANGKWYNHLWNVWKGIKHEARSIGSIIGTIFGGDGSAVDGMRRTFSRRRPIGF